MELVRRCSYLFIFTLIFSSISVAQKSPATEADKLFSTFQYKIAADMYKKAYGKVKKNPVERRRIMFRMAESYSMMGDLKKAEQQYLRLEKVNYQKDNPLIFIRLGDIYRIKKDYPSALQYYEKYKQVRPNDPRIDSRIESSKLAPQWINNPTRHEIENMKKFNTPQSEWSPSWGVPGKENQLVFTSSREGSTGKGEDVWSGQSFSDLYVSNKPKSKLVDFPGEWTTPVVLDNENIVNTEANEGESSFNPKGTTLYFTRCPNEKKTISYCKIYQVTRKGKSWGAPEEIILGPDSFDYVHPSISSDELTLYFASDMHGTMGGYDIWSVSRDKKARPFGNLTNLGKNINSNDHDMFPALEDDSTLYFASKGHVGLGGYDIFKSQYINNEWTPAENLKYPINSESDDYAILFDHTLVMDPVSGFPFIEKGYFTSNRPGGRGMDDIWSFKLPPLMFTLAGFIRDSVTRQFVDGVTVILTTSDGTSYKTTTDIRGYYSFDKTKVLGELTYEIIVQKTGYYENDNAKGRETTVGLTENKDLKHDFIIDPVPKEPVILPDILFDLAKWDLKPQYEDSLRGLLQIMEDNPTFVIELRSHTDIRPIPMTNDTLSQRRAESSIRFLIESGIDPDRLIAKGYGERAPRVLDKDIVSRGYTFKKGTVLSGEFINSLKSRNEQEAAHDLNRRTEFLILRDDYIPKENIEPLLDASVAVINIVSQSFIPIETQDNLVYGTCYANSKTLRFMIEPNVAKASISYDQAMRFLKDAIIKVGDFELKDKAIVPEDGTIIDKSIVYLNTFQIGDEVLENVEMTVIKEQKEPVIIGSKTFEEEFGSYTINKEEGKLIFNK
ncbi:MAG: OmpA family protein [Bacteroidales bacterium]|jgi:peptidoglycan-associated lipoprotein|nr:OmpA family protein [Bacteroidales bacterium]